MKAPEVRSLLLEALTEGHTIKAACERAGVSRMFYDRHYKDDADFRKKVDAVRKIGRETNNDRVESAYMKKIADGDSRLIKYYLEHNVEPYKKKNPSEEKRHRAIFSVGDIRFLIDGLPEPLRSLNYDRLRDIIGDANLHAKTETDPEESNL